MEGGAYETEISTEISDRNFCHIFENETFFLIFLQKKPKNCDFEVSVAKYRRVRGQIFSFFGMSLVRAQTW